MMTFTTLKAWTQPEPVEAMILYPRSLMNIAEWVGANRIQTDKKFEDGTELITFWNDNHCICVAPIDRVNPVLIVKNLKTNQYHYVDAEHWGTDFDDKGALSNGI